MRKLFTKYIKLVFLILLISGVAGGILFLPVALDGNYTCLYHKMVQKNNQVNILANDTGVKISECEAVQESENGHHSISPSGHDLLNTYLANYAFLWWGSLALAGFCFYRLRCVNRKRKILHFPMEEKTK